MRRALQILVETLREVLRRVERPPKDVVRIPAELVRPVNGRLLWIVDQEAAGLLEKGLGESCRHVVLAHLSRKNNHAELARMNAEEALARGGRKAVQLTLAGVLGTEWIEVRRAAPPPGADRQLRLF